MSNVGVAAHITAASPGFKRYDPTLMPEQRSGIENGIWLCQNCAKMIDDDEITYTTQFLRKWRSDAEARAANELGKTSRGQIEVIDGEFFDGLEANLVYAGIRGCDSIGPGIAVLEMLLRFEVKNVSRRGIPTWDVGFDFSHPKQEGLKLFKVHSVASVSEMILPTQTKMLPKTFGFTVYERHPVVMYLSQGLAEGVINYFPLCEQGIGRTKSDKMADVRGHNDIYQNAINFLKNKLNWRP